MGQYFVAVLSRGVSKSEFVDGIEGRVRAWDFDNGAKLMEHAYIGNPVPGTVVSLIAADPARVVWAGDYADEEVGGSTLYRIVDGARSLTAEPEDGSRYILDLDRLEYVDLHCVEPFDADGDWRVHPLPLLTCEGNGRGGGDFRGSDPYLGLWARDLVTAAADGWEPSAGWEQIFPEFQES